MSGCPRPTLLTSTVLSLLLPAALASADGVTIGHKPVGCVVAGQFPLISADFGPTPNVGGGRVYFRAAGGANWYFVEMKLENGLYVGVLPMPMKETVKIEYYIEAIDKAFATSRTAEYTPQVVAGSGECGKEGLAATALASAKLVVGSVAGAPALPAGFSAVGIASTAGGATAGTAAGGGVSKVLLVGALGAGAAVATVVATRGSDESAVNVSGHWVGVATSVTKKQGRPDCTSELDLTLDISQSGSSLSGSGTAFERVVCGENDGLMTVTITGSLNGHNVTMTAASRPIVPNAVTVIGYLSGSVTGDRMSGTLTGTSHEDETITGTWTLERQ